MSPEKPETVNTAKYTHCGTGLASVEPIAALAAVAAGVERLMSLPVSTAAPEPRARIMSDEIRDEATQVSIPPSRGRWHAAAASRFIVISFAAQYRASFWVGLPG